MKAEKIIIENVLIVDEQSKHHQQVRNVGIADGKIILVQDTKISWQDAIVIDGHSHQLSPGFVDLRASFCDPGMEHHENLYSGMEAAAAGGFTSVCVNGDTLPAIQTKTTVEYILNHQKNAAVNLHPVGLASHADGELTEMFDMKSAGAIAFSNHKNPVNDAHLLSRILLYCKGINALFIQIPFDKKLNASGLVHEGKISTSLGLKGIPSLSEEISIRQQLAITADLDCAIHFGGISTARSVELIREAKAKGQKVTCDVHIMNLMFTDEQLLNFNTNFKVMPPLRTTADREALVGGLKDNTIDAICSDHTPRDVESKVKEFQIADFGASTIETCFAMAVESLTGHLSISEIISKLAHSPRSILNLPAVSIDENQKAELTLFSTQPDHLSAFDVSETKSLSRNQPMHGKKLAAAIRCTINGLHLSGVNQSLTV